jgi:hypothetical protein
VKLKQRGGGGSLASEGILKKAKTLNIFGVLRL